MILDLKALHQDPKVPLYRRLYQVLRQAILDGQLRAGARLPASRALAADLGLSRTTVQGAYDQLLAEGYVQGRVGAGTYVCESLESGRGSGEGRVGRPQTAALDVEVAAGLPDTATVRRLRERGTRPLLSAVGAERRRPVLDLRAGLPPLLDFPHAGWRRLVGRQLRRTDMARFDYGPAAGAVELCDAVAAYLRRSRGLACDGEQVVITGGSQRALDVIARVFLDAGDIAVVEDPGYEGARSALQLAGARIAAVPVDGDGMDPTRLDRAVADVRAVADGTDIGASRGRSAGAAPVRLVHVAPSHQYPLGARMPLSRRLQLLEWAAAHEAFVVEDDYDGEFQLEGRPLAPLASLDDAGRVLYVGTFSKVMFPALRLGYVVAPAPVAELLARAKALTDGGTSLLEQLALAEFLDGGGFELYLRRTRVRMRERRRALLDALHEHLGNRVEILGAPCGLHVVARFPGVTVAEGHELVRRARRHGLGLYPTTPYYYGARAPAAELVLGFAAMDVDEIRRGVALMVQLLDEGSPRAAGG